jgi:hypothetical protein
MYLNQKPSESLAVLGTIDPVSQAAGTITTGWLDAGQYFSVMALIQTGVLGASATVDAKLQQATDSSGTGAKDVTGKSITQIVKASGDNKQVLLNAKGADFDVEGGFRYFRLSITVGTAASLISATVFGCYPRMAVVANQSATVQVV